MEKFNYEPNGYNRKEVNQFISDVIDQTSGIVEKYKKQKETIYLQQQEIEKLKVQVEHYKKYDKDLKQSIVKAEMNANEMKNIARQQANIIIDDAKKNASRIVNEALIKADEIENRTLIAAKNLKVLKQKLQIMVEQQKAIVDEIDDIEII